MIKKLALCCSLIAFSSVTNAHLLKVFAHSKSISNGDQISVNGKVYFAGGAALPNLKIKVVDASGKTVFSPTTKSDGSFIFNTIAGNYQIIANSHDGHIAKWKITAKKNSTINKPAISITTDSLSISNAQTQKLIENLIANQVSEQIAPLSEQINSLQEKVMFQDVIGALGYIFGLYGFAMWYRQRKAK